jgi:hypothetical protein
MILCQHDIFVQKSCVLYHTCRSVPQTLIFIVGANKENVDAWSVRTSPAPPCHIDEYYLNNRYCKIDLCTFYMLNFLIKTLGIGCNSSRNFNHVISWSWMVSIRQQPLHPQWTGPCTPVSGDCAVHPLWALWRRWTFSNAGNWTPFFRSSSVYFSLYWLSYQDSKPLYNSLRCKQVVFKHNIHCKNFLHKPTNIKVTNFNSSNSCCCCTGWSRRANQHFVIWQYRSLCEKQSCDYVSNCEWLPRLSCWNLRN